MNRLQLNVDTTYYGRWTDLFKLAAWSCWLFSFSIVLAVAAYIVWAYAPGQMASETLLIKLEEKPVGTLMSLDFFMLPAAALTILPTVGLFVILRKVNESYALLLLVFGLMGIVIIFAGRPVLEMTQLSTAYSLTADSVQKQNYVAAAEALLTMFDGTAWMASMVFMSLSGIFAGMGIFKSPLFKTGHAWLVLTIAMLGLAIFIPVIGPLLSLFATVGSIIWNLILAQVFFRIVRLRHPLK